MSERTYQDALIEWGRSGKLRPNLLPSESSASELQAVQSSLAAVNPGFGQQEDLHCTMYYLNPAALFKSLQAMGSSVTEADLYAGLMHPARHAFKARLGTHVLEVHGVAEIEGMGLMGSGNIAALVMKETTALAEFRQVHRDFLRKAILDAGVTRGHIDKLATEDDYKWTFGGSRMHVSLGRVDDGLIVPRNILYPETITFTGVDMGSVKPPTGYHDYAWYIDPL